MCHTTFDAMDRYRVAFWTARCRTCVPSLGPHDYVDGAARHDPFQPYQYVACQRACLDRRGSHPDRLRTAEGRRRERDLKLLVNPSDPDYIHKPPATYYMLPTTLLLHAAYDLIYTYIYIDSTLHPYRTI